MAIIVKCFAKKTNNGTYRARFSVIEDGLLLENTETLQTFRSEEEAVQNSIKKANDLQRKVDNGRIELDYCDYDPKLLRNTNKVTQKDNVIYCEENMFKRASIEDDYYFCNLEENEFNSNEEAVSLSEIDWNLEEYHTEYEYNRYDEYLLFDDDIFFDMFDNNKDSRE